MALWQAISNESQTSSCSVHNSYVLTCLGMHKARALWWRNVSRHHVYTRGGKYLVYKAGCIYMDPYLGIILWGIKIYVLLVIMFFNEIVLCWGHNTGHAIFLSRQCIGFEKIREVCHRDFLLFRRPRNCFGLLSCFYIILTKIRKNIFLKEKKKRLAGYVCGLLLLCLVTYRQLLINIEAITKLQMLTYNNWHITSI